MGPGALLKASPGETDIISLTSVWRPVLGAAGGGGWVVVSPKQSLCGYSDLLMALFQEGGGEDAW